MPATGCSAGPRRRPRCAARRRARRAPSAVDARDCLAQPAVSDRPAHRRADRRNRVAGGCDRHGAAPCAVAAATPGRPGRWARSAVAARGRRPARRRRPRSTVSSARDAGCSATGTPDRRRRPPVHPPRSARGTAPRRSAAPSGRSTAICDHGTPSTRWALRSASAISAASACGDAASRTRHRARMLARADQFAGRCRRRATAARRR